MTKKLFVMDNAVIILNNINRAQKFIDKLKFMEKLFNHIWENRIIIRKDGYLCKVIHKKTLLLEHKCRSMGLLPPEILKNILKI